ncbi:hypothetical protein LCGC14_1333140 [marine sediment metagenome]|uniref:Uncharacterized protein n=1 Tax=marine sediment metagenome TaxID=412755 RepID=A0A0F9KFV3_9ZZZZ
MNQYHAIRDSDPRVANMCCRILPPLPGSNIDQMCIQERGHDEGRHENGDGTVKPWPERIPAAIAKAEELLTGNEYVLISPHIGGNKTNLTLVLTAGEVALASRMAELYEMGIVYEATTASNVPGRSLVAFVEKIEGLSR